MQPTATAARGRAIFQTSEACFEDEEEFQGEAVEPRAKRQKLMQVTVKKADPWQPTMTYQKM